MKSPHLRKDRCRSKHRKVQVKREGCWSGDGQADRVQGSRRDSKEQLPEEQGGKEGQMVKYDQITNLLVFLTPF